MIMLFAFSKSYILSSIFKSDDKLLIVVINIMVFVVDQLRIELIAKAIISVKIEI